MPNIAQGASADFSVSVDSTLTVYNPDGYATVEYPIGTVIADGSGTWTVDMKSGTARVNAVQGIAYAEVTADPEVGRSSALLVASETRLGVGAAPLFRAVLFGDSMTSQFEGDNTPAMTYDAATGVIACASTGHGLETGWTVALHCNQYASLQPIRYLAVAVTDANNYTLQVEQNLPDVPNGVLSGSCFVRYETRRPNYSWINMAMGLLGWPADIVRNAAASGQTAQHRLDSIDQALALAPQIVFMQLPGINDMAISNGSADDETVFARQCAIVDRIIASGATLVCGGVTPVFTGHVQAGGQDMARVASLDRRMRERMRGNRNVIWLDNYGTVVNPASASGLARSGYLRSDNIHYSGYGAYRVGKAAADAIKARLGDGNWSTLPKSVAAYYHGAKVTASSVSIASGVATFAATAHGFRAGERVGIYGSSTSGVNGWTTIVSASANSFTFSCAAADGAAAGTITASRARNVTANPLFATATGGTVSSPVTGTAAADARVYIVSGTATVAADVIPDPNGYGNMQRATISAADANAQIAIQAASTTAMLATVTPGEKYFLEAFVRLHSADWTKTPLSEFMVAIKYATALQYPYVAANYTEFTPDGEMPSELLLHVRSSAQIVPAGATQMYWQLLVKAGAAFGAALQIGISRVALVRAE